VNRFGYLWKSAWKNLGHNRLMNIVAISTTALALLMVGSVLLFQQNLSSLVHRMKSEATVVAYLKEGVGDDQRQEVQLKINPDPRVSDVQYRSPEEAMEIFKERFGEESDLLEGLEGNPLPGSFIVKLEPDALGEINQLAEKIRSFDTIESVDYGEEIVQVIQDISGGVQVVLAVIGILISLVAIFIIFNTIQLTVVSRQTEIDILKLVGATRSFIGVPFVISGFIQGLLGSVFGLGLLAGLYWTAQQQLTQWMFFPVDLAFLTPVRMSFLVVFGMVLGGIGSVTAVYRTVRDI